MKKTIIIILAFFLLTPFPIIAQESQSGLKFYTEEELKKMDTDRDGLSDFDEMHIYKTDLIKADTDGDGYSDGEEIKYNYDPNKNLDDKIAKNISVSIEDQTLTYSVGSYALKTIKISSGISKMDTPKGEFSILKKIPVTAYGTKGGKYYYPNTRWNMLFRYQSKGNLYIHGAYWHNNFGKRMSHGCINVSYDDVEALYNWADVGTKIIIN